MNDKALQRN